jgi:hypothetical protein
VQKLGAGGMGGVSRARHQTQSPRRDQGPALDVCVEANPVSDRRQVDLLPDCRVLGVMSQASDAINREFAIVLHKFDEVRQRALK